jgi:hypothetical protein
VGGFYPHLSLRDNTVPPRSLMRSNAWPASLRMGVYCAARSNSFDFGNIFSPSASSRGQTPPPRTREPRSARPTPRARGTGNDFTVVCQLIPSPSQQPANSKVGSGNGRTRHSAIMVNSKSSKMSSVPSRYAEHTTLQRYAIRSTKIPLLLYSLISWLISSPKVNWC